MLKHIFLRKNGQKETKCEKNRWRRTISIFLFTKFRRNFTSGEYFTCQAGNFLSGEYLSCMEYLQAGNFSSGDNYFTSGEFLGGGYLSGGEFCRWGIFVRRGFPGGEYLSGGEFSRSEFRTRFNKIIGVILLFLIIINIM